MNADSIRILNKAPLRISGGYAALGALWILYSDQTVEFLGMSPSWATWTQTFKGWGFVAVTSLLLYVLLRRVVHAAQDSHRSVQENESFYHAVVESAGSAIVLIDPAGVISWANDEFVRLCGGRRDQVLGRPWTAYFDPERLPSETLRRMPPLGVTREPRHCFETELVCEDGRRLDVAVSVGALPDSPQVVASFIDISDRRRMEWALRASESKYRSIFENSAMGIFRATVQGELLDINPAFARIFGYTSVEEAKQSIDYLWRGIVVDPANTSPIEEVRDVKDTVSLVVQFQRKDGAAAYCRQYFRMVRDEGQRAYQVEGFLEDITRQVIASAALKESEHRYRELVESMSSGLMVLEARNDGAFFMVKDFNRAAERMEGLSRLEVIGCEVRESLPGSVDFGLQEILERVWRTGAPERFEARQYKDERVNAWREGYVYRLASGEVVAVFDDVTERIRARREAQEREQQLIQADKMISLGTLSAGVAHEINNPNHLISLNAPIVRTAWKDITPVLEEYYREQGEFMLAGMPYGQMRANVPRLIDGIIDGAARIRSIVLDMKDFARQDTAGMDQRVDINAVIRSALALLANTIKNSTARLEQHLADDLPSILGNRQRLEQVAINLLLNALDSLPDKRRGLTIRTEGTARGVLVEVEDEGEGIAPENLPRIFDPFFTTKRTSGGTGLGLSISDSIVKAHGGAMEFTSQLGGGTTVRLYFPAAPPADSEEEL